MSGIRLAALSVVLALASGLSYGQSGALTPFDKLPDWTGTWQMVGPTIFDNATKTGKGGVLGVGVREHPPYNEVYEKKYEANLALRDKNLLPDPKNVCGIPDNYPRIINTPDAYEFVVRPDEFYIIAENGENDMRVYTDGRPLPKKEDLWGTYTGVSVGHWDGGTLVFDTVGLKGDRDNKPGQVPDYILDRTGLILSDAVHTTTRVRKINDNTLQFEVTIYDSKALTKPWVVTKQFSKQKPGLFLYDYGCRENNRNPVEANGAVETLGPDGKPFNSK